MCVQLPILIGAAHIHNTRPLLDTSPFTIQLPGQAEVQKHIQLGRVLLRRLLVLRAGRKLAKHAAARVGSLGLVAVKDGEQALPDLAGLLAGINSLPDAGVLVVANDGGGLLVVGRKTLLKRLGVVIRALDEGLAGGVVGHGHLGGVEDLVVRAARGGVDETASDAGDEQGIIDLQLNGVLQGLVALAQHGVEALGLGHGAREAVEDKAALALGVLVQLLLDHANNDVVADEAAVVHDLLGLKTEGGLLGDLGSEHVTGGLEWSIIALAT